MGKTLTERQLQAIEKWGQALLLDKNGGLLAGGALRARLAKLEKDKQEVTLAQYEARRNQVLRIKGEVLAQMRSEVGGGEAMTFPHANRLADDFVGGRNQKLNDLTDNDEVEWLLRSAAGLDVDLHLAKLEASASGEVKGANKGTVEGVTEESVQEIIEETGYDPTVLHAAIEEMRGEVAKATVAMSAAGEQLNQKKAAKRAAKKAAEAAKEEKKVKFQNMMASVAGLEREFLIEVALHLGGNCKKAVLANVNSGTPIPEKTMKKIESLSQAEIAGLAIAAQQRRANDEDSKRRAEEEAKAKEAEAERIKNSSRANAQDENKAGEDAGEEEKVKNDSKKKGGEKKVAWYRRLIASVAAMFSRNPEKNAKSEKRAMRAWARIVRKEVKANLPEGKLCSGAGPVAEYIESLFGAIQALRQKWEAQVKETRKSGGVPVSCEAALRGGLYAEFVKDNRATLNAWQFEVLKAAVGRGPDAEKVFHDALRNTKLEKEGQEASLPYAKDSVLFGIITRILCEVSDGAFVQMTPEQRDELVRFEKKMSENGWWSRVSDFASSFFWRGLLYVTAVAAVIGEWCWNNKFATIAAIVAGVVAGVGGMGFWGVVGIVAATIVVIKAVTWAFNKIRGWWRARKVAKTVVGEATVGAGAQTSKDDEDIEDAVFESC